MIISAAIVVACMRKQEAEGKLTHHHAGALFGSAGHHGRAQPPQQPAEAPQEPQHGQPVGATQPQATPAPSGAKPEPKAADGHTHKH